MAYIYKITNDINSKVYIGKTQFSIEKRFQEHCKDAFKEKNEKRPLYSAMRKYGIEHFHVELIEETVIPEQREIYWIEYYGSFKYGYNATMGGDGKRYCDYDLIYSLYCEGKNILEISQATGYDIVTCRIALDEHGVSHEERVERGRQKIKKTVLQLDRETEEIIAIFPSIQEAYRFLNKPFSSHISAVCKGKRKTAYGYKWRYGQ